MTILNIGSVNIDHVYSVAHHPAPGETLADDGYVAGLGGKGVNMSLAAALAGAQVRHAGCIGADGTWCRERLAAVGVDVADLHEVDTATGHAIVMVDPSGENVILIHPGANRALTQAQVRGALARCAPGDWLLVQNETNLVPEATAAAKGAGLRVAYAAAPFDPAAAEEVLPHTDLLAVNAVEAAQLAQHLGCDPASLPVPMVLVTRGAEGASWHADGARHDVAPFAVTPVDTTGAGDTFLGVALAGLDTGLVAEAALRRAAAAAAIQITRPGAADAIPTAAEIDHLLEHA